MTCWYFLPAELSKSKREVPANKKQSAVFTLIRRLPGSLVSIPGILKIQLQSIKQLTNMIIIAAILEIYLTLVFNCNNIIVWNIYKHRGQYRNRHSVFEGCSALKCMMRCGGSCLLNAEVR
jgi:hypothetical protein